jgi:hypothetical protein
MEWMYPSEDSDDALAVVMVGGSAGALSAVRCLAESLPLVFPAALIIAQHVAKPSVLSERLRLWTKHPVHVAADGDRASNGGRRARSDFGAQRDRVATLVPGRCRRLAGSRLDLATERPV